MAIRDTSVTGSFSEDRDQNVFIGIDMPFRKSEGVEGYFAATSTTIAAVKNNIRNLLLTNKGERYFQPNLGLNLRKVLFEQFTDDTIASVQREIVDTITTWLPFVEIKELNVNKEGGDSIAEHTLKINVVFSIQQAPNILESIEVAITGD